jgi:hypothetical protein
VLLRHYVCTLPRSKHQNDHINLPNKQVPISSRSWAVVVSGVLFVFCLLLFTKDSNRNLRGKNLFLFYFFKAAYEGKMPCDGGSVCINFRHPVIFFMTFDTSFEAQYQRLVQWRLVALS